MFQHVSTLGLQLLDPIAHGPCHLRALRSWVDSASGEEGNKHRGPEMDPTLGERQDEPNASNASKKLKNIQEHQ